MTYRGVDLDEIDLESCLIDAYSGMKIVYSLLHSTYEHHFRNPGKALFSDAYEEVRMSLQGIQDMFYSTLADTADAVKAITETAEKKQGPAPEEGTTVADATTVLEAFRKLDKLARDMVIKQVLKDEEVAIDGKE